MPDEQMLAVQARLRAAEWLDMAMRLAEEVGREIEANGTDIDLSWIQDKVQDIAWHCRGALGDPGPHPPSINPTEGTRPGVSTSSPGAKGVGIVPTTEQERIDQLEFENLLMREALQGIAEFSTGWSYGYTDEWTEAMAFTWCQQTAEAALKGESLPEYPQRRGY